MKKLNSLLLVIVISLLCPAAYATQHLVSPGDDWERLASRLRPGDEIILLPGRHAPASFTDLQGTMDQPIVIRGFDAARPAHIAAREFGIELIRPTCVVLRDLRIIKAAEHGIRISGRADDRTLDAPWNAAVRINRVSIDATGDYEDGVAFFLDGIRQCHIEELQCTGWGRAALEARACADITAERCRFEGTDNFEQTLGAEFSAGTQLATLERCRFTNITDACILVGGNSLTTEFSDQSVQRASEGALFESERIAVARCILQGGATSIRFISAHRCSVYACTIANPRYWAFSFAESERAESRRPTTGIQFGRNLIVSDSADFGRPFLVEAAVAPGEITIEDNLWWIPAIEELELPAKPVFPQVFDIDPALGAEWQPTNPKAATFGAVDAASGSDPRRVGAASSDD